MNTNKTNSDITQVIDALLDDLAAMVESSNSPPETFFGKIVYTTETLFAPQYIAILAKEPAGGNLVVSASKSLTGKTAIPELAADSYFSKFLEDENEPPTITVDFDSFRMVASRIGAEDGPWGGLVAKFDTSANVDALVPVLDAIRELASQFVASRLRSQDPQFFQELVRFSLNSHLSLEPKRVGNILANDARMILNCERLSVFQVSGRRPVLLSVSSVAAVENRSILAKRMNRLVELACKAKSPFFSEQPPAERTLNDALSLYREVSGFPFIVGIPLAKPSPSSGQEPELAGYMLAESDRDINRFEFSRGLQVVAPHMGLALNNAQHHASIPFRRSLSLLRKVFDISNLPGMLISALIVLAGFWCLFGLKTDFTIRINGELRPQVERTVFAPSDGFVEKVLVDQGDSVKENQILIELGSPALELEMEKLSGERTRTEQLRETKKIALNQAATGNLGDQLTLGKLASEISELEFELGAIEEKKKFLQKRIDELVIHSPIDGRVTTWQLKRNILQKPVRWGDGLADIAFENGEWNLNFKVPEYRIGYLLEARENSDEPLEIEFFFESNPTQKLKTRILEVAQSTELDPEFGPVVTVICDVPTSEFQKRHGARVIADVKCGRKPVAIAWTQELVDSIKRKFVW